MAYSKYDSPGVNVMVQRQQVEKKSPETQFYPVFVGAGITSRNRSIEKTNIRANTEKFPEVTLAFSLAGDMNTDLFPQTKFTVGQAEVKRSSVAEGADTSAVLEPGEGYEVVKDLSFRKSDATASITINVLDETVTKNDVLYNLNISASNIDKDFDLRAVGVEDRFLSSEMYGPIVLKENDTEFYNDIAIAAEIAFRMQVERFYYLEVPRNYGEEPTPEDFKKAIDKVYYKSDAYRVVPLTNSAEVASAVNQFVAGVSNPVDRRETVAFVNYDPMNIDNMDDIDELVEKVGGFSASLNNKRVCNVFAGSSADITIDGQVFVVPPYFVAAAVVALDAVIGKVNPLSLLEINVFDKIEVPRFRPREWDRLAKQGVFIIQKDSPDEPAFIRHQLTTAQTEAAEDQEYSVVKNFDVVTKKIRDRFKPYAGQNNIDAGYTERLEGTMATVRQEILEEKLAKNLTVITPWQVSDGGDKRNLVTRLSLDPVFPSNVLDVYLVV